MPTSGTNHFDSKAKNSYKWSYGYESGRQKQLNTQTRPSGRVYAGRGGMERVRRSIGLGREHQ